MAAARVVSAGLVITDGRAVLLGHSTGNPWWDIPKGLIDPGETALAACVREVYEETGLQVAGLPLADLGRRPYLEKKDLHVFRLVLPALPPLHALVCTSTFYDRRTGLHRPELDGFAHVPLGEIARYARPPLVTLIRLAVPG